MATFLIRIELRDTPSDHADYKQLHEEMREGGFYQILFNHGLVRLPHAEYCCERESTANEILSQVCRIASGVKTRPRVVVTEAVTIVHHGLESVRAATIQAAAVKVAARSARSSRLAHA